MALTGLQIQKLLPKTNCKECGSNTCMAFAMKLAAKKAELSQCPYASEEAKKILGAASRPPVRSVELGADRALKLGEETVLYRHEKTFARQPLFAVNIDDTAADFEIDSLVQRIRDFSLVRVGETLRIELVAVTERSGSAERYMAVARRCFEQANRPLVIRSEKADILCAAAHALKGSRSVLCFATPANVERLVKAAQDNDQVLAVSASDLNELVALTGSLRKREFTDILIQYPTDSLAAQFRVNTIARRAAIKDNYESLGYPGIRFFDSGDLFSDTIAAVNEITKYGGLCVLSSFDPAQLTSLMALRMNIFTDPQKPIQVEPNVYPIGDPGPDSPVFVTTNFSLTYFIVAGEIENSGTSAWLVVPECEGMSVLTAWAAGKFSGESIAKFIKNSGLEFRVATRLIVIPGYVAQISGELEENLSGWKVMVGPQEAADIESFVKERLK
jgi:acetyl-CoA decarbonylase/synthase complex subunit gamma